MLEVDDYQRIVERDLRERDDKPNGGTANFPEDGVNEEAKPDQVIESFPVFAERVSQKPALREIVTELHTEDSIGLSHGQPRDGKTLFEQHTALCVALGRSVLGIDRFSIVSPQPVSYLTEEDSERRTLERLDAMLCGFGVDKRPANFFLAVRRGITLDEMTWQRYLIKATKEIGFKYVVIDPLRAFTAHADQGPSELKPLVLFLRRFMTETGCSVRLVHHDTKPLQGKGDDRKRAQRASGGGIFSIADAPLSFERISDNQTLVVPCGFKFAETPSPFRFTLKTEQECSRLVSIKLIGDNVMRSEAEAFSLNEKILELIKKTPGKSGSAIATAIGKRKDDVLTALNQLLAASRVDSVTGFTSSNGRLVRPKPAACARLEYRQRYWLVCRHFGRPQSISKKRTSFSHETARSSRHSTSPKKSLAHCSRPRLKAALAVCTGCATSLRVC